MIMAKSLWENLNYYLDETTTIPDNNREVWSIQEHFSGKILSYPILFITYQYLARPLTGLRLWSTERAICEQLISRSDHTRKQFKPENPIINTQKHQNTYTES